MSVSCCCYNKLPQTVAQSSTSLLPYSSGVQKLRMGPQGCVPSEGSRKKAFPCFFQCLEAFCLPWFMASSSTFKTRNRVTSNLPLCFHHHISSDFDLLACLKGSLVIILGPLGESRVISSFQNPEINHICKIPLLYMVRGSKD